MEAILPDILLHGKNRFCWSI